MEGKKSQRSKRCVIRIAESDECCRLPRDVCLRLTKVDKYCGFARN